MDLKIPRRNLGVETGGQDLGGIITTIAPIPGPRFCGALVLHLVTDLSP
jgi:hypothetical protein